MQNIMTYKCKTYPANHDKIVSYTMQKAGFGKHLNDDESLRLQQHIAACDDCRDHMEFMAKELFDISKNDMDLISRNLDIVMGKVGPIPHPFIIEGIESTFASRNLRSGTPHKGDDDREYLGEITLLLKLDGTQHSISLKLSLDDYAETYYVDFSSTQEVVHPFVVYYQFCDNAPIELFNSEEEEITLPFQPGTEKRGIQLDVSKDDFNWNEIRQNGKAKIFIKYKSEER